MGNCSCQAAGRIAVSRTHSRRICLPGHFYPLCPTIFRRQSGRRGTFWFSENCCPFLPPVSSDWKRRLSVPVLGAENPAPRPTDCDSTAMRLCHTALGQAASIEHLPQRGCVTRSAAESAAVPQPTQRRWRRTRKRGGPRRPRRSGLRATTGREWFRPGPRRKSQRNRSRAGDWLIFPQETNRVWAADYDSVQTHSGKMCLSPSLPVNGFEKSCETTNQ